MRAFVSWQFCGLFLALASAAGGCNKDDADCMARVGRKVTARAEALATTHDGSLGKGWQAVRNGWQETALDGRVSARLRGDKNLADCKIYVTAAGNTVELKGTVRDLAQRRRAVDLAESTAGVEKVTDALEVPAQ